MTKVSSQADYCLVEDGIWIEIGELIVVIGKWAILMHVHIGNFDRFFGIDFRRLKIVVDPVIECRNTRMVKVVRDD